MRRRPRWSASDRCRSRRRRSVPTGGRAAAPAPVRRCRRPSRTWRPGCGHGRRSRSSYRRPGDRRSRIRLLKLCAAAGALQPVDAAIAAVVEHGHDQLLAQHDRGLQLRVHHHVAAVADHDEDFAVGHGPSSRRARRRSRSPCRRSRIPCGSRWALLARHSLCSSPGSPPAAQTTMSFSPGRAVDRTHHLGVGRQLERWSGPWPDRRRRSTPRPAPWCAAARPGTTA